MTRAPDLDCRLCGWYGWGGRNVMLRHVFGGQCVRRVIARATEPWLKRLPSQTRSQCAGPVAQPPPAPPAPPEREWLTFGIPMELVAITDPGPVDLPREAAPHEGAPGIPGYGGGASTSGLRWRRVGMASFQEQVQRQLQWEQRRGREPEAGVDYDALRSRSHCYEQFQQYPGGGAGYHGYEEVRVKLRRRAVAPADSTGASGRSTQED